MSFSPWSLELSAVLFAGMVVCLEAGYRLGRRRLAVGTYKSLSDIETAIFALLGLLLGFAFAGATSRFEARRALIVQETNAIGTAYLRLDLVPASDQPDLRRLFRSLSGDAVTPPRQRGDPTAAAPLIEEVAALQQKIWTRAVRATAGDDGPQSAKLLVLPALNEMIDVTTARVVAAQTRLPELILGLLMSVAMLSALLAGFAVAETGRSWLHILLVRRSGDDHHLHRARPRQPQGRTDQARRSRQVLTDLLQSIR